MRRVTLTLTAAALLSMPLTPALADEAWMTQFGPMQWEETRGSMAILNMFGAGVDNPAQFRVFLPRLADDVNGGRGAYLGFWTSDRGDSPCAVELVDPMGTKTRHWGQFTLNFVGDAFPSDWAGLYGDCFDAPLYRLTGTVLTDF
jgi:hypothetical protein